MPRSEPLPDNNCSAGAAGSGATGLPAGGGRQRDRRGARVRGRRRDRARRSGRAAGPGRSDPGARLPRRRGHATRSRPGSCWPRPVRTRWAATSRSTARSAPGPPRCTSRTATTPGSRGVRYLTEQQIADHLVACTLAGVQAGFHAIGDDAVSAVGRALREAAGRLGRATRPCGWRAARTGSSTPRWPTTRPSPRSPRPARSPACSRCSTRPGVARTGCTRAGSGADRAAGMNPFADHGRGRRRAGVRFGRAGDAPPTRGRRCRRPRTTAPRAASYLRGRRSPRTPGAVTGRRAGPTGGSAPSASARRRTWRSSRPASWSGRPPIRRWPAGRPTRGPGCRCCRT